MNETARLKSQIRTAEELIARSRTRLAMIEREREKRVTEFRAKGRVRRLVRGTGIEIEDDMKEFDRIGVWPAKRMAVDLHDGDHYVYSWTEAENRVRDYLS